MSLNKNNKKFMSILELLMIYSEQYTAYVYN